MSASRRTGGLAIDPFGPRSRERNLIPPPSTAPIGAKSSDLGRYAFPLGFAVVILTFVLPSNMLVHLGLYSELPGGNPLTKFHPATYMAVLAALFALYGRRHGGGMVGLFRERPVLAWSVILILGATIYSVISFGIGGIALYVETYLSAALLLIALETGTERQLRRLGYFILTAALVNIVISLIETRLATHFLEPSSGIVGDKAIGDFRGAGLYTHPLTGSLVSAMTFFLVSACGFARWSPWR